MQRWTTYTLRAVFIIGFLIILPVMAMPSVAKLLDGLLYGEPEKSVPTTEAEQAVSPNASTIAEASQATHEVPLSPEGTALPEEPGSHSLAGRFPAAPPPPLQHAPDFLPREEGPGTGEPATPAADVGPLDQATASQIDAVRGRLEELGAEYVRLEMSEDGRKFHCLCDMLLGGDDNKTQPFEATRTDPVAAVQAVLTNVEAWRNAERTPARGTKSGPPPRTR